VCIHLVSIGTVNRTLVHPREVFTEAIRVKATSIILCHNHPSGNLIPSDEDIETTELLLEVSDIVGIDILDHIIFDCNNYFSFLENKILFSQDD
jgi:DNA repair protein RadC